MLHTRTSPPSVRHSSDVHMATAAAAADLCTPASLHGGSWHCNDEVSIPPPHNFYDGPPFLCCSVPQELLMLHELQPTIERARQLGKQQIDVWVDWGNDATVVVSPFGECRLSVRLSGHEISYAVGVCWRRLHVRFAVGTAPAGTSFLAELRWQGGSRNLHVLAPPCTVNLHNLVLPPPSNQPNDDDAGESARVLDARGLLDRIDAAEAAAPPLPLHAETFSRGFGLELEYLTEAERDEKGTSLKREQLQDALARLSEPTGTSPEADRHLDGIRASLARCREWNSSIDIAILPTPQSLSNRMLDATGVLGAMVDAVRRAEVRQRSLNMLLRRGAITKSEFQSPLPPDELRFERAAALDIGCFIHGALGATGAVATTISAACHCSTTLHVHVNVRNPEAGGALLTAEEILDVFFHWVRLRALTRQLSRGRKEFVMALYPPSMQRTSSRGRLPTSAPRVIHSIGRRCASIRSRSHSLGRGCGESPRARRCWRRAPRWALSRTRGGRAKARGARASPTSSPRGAPCHAPCHAPRSWTQAPRSHLQVHAWQPTRGTRRRLPPSSGSHRPTSRRAQGNLPVTGPVPSSDSHLLMMASAFMACTHAAPLPPLTLNMPRHRLIPPAASGMTCPPSCARRGPSCTPTASRSSQSSKRLAASLGSAARPRPSHASARST